MSIEEFKRILVSISDALLSLNCKNIYDFILNFSNIKMDNPSITESQIKELSLEKLKQILNEICEYYMDVLQQYPEQIFVVRVISVSIFGMRILSDDNYKKIYDELRDYNYINSVNDIKDLSVENINSISKGLDVINNNTLIKAIPVTNEDIESYNENNSDIECNKHKL